jgi:integrase
MPKSPSLPQDPVPSSPARLSNAAKAFVRAAIAPNTLRVYRSQWAQWCRFAANNAISPLPADPAMVANWLAARAATTAGQLQPRTLSTLRTALAAVRFAHLSADVSFDSSHPAIALVLRGIARMTMDAPRQAQPLRAATVADILARLGTSPRERRDAAVLALGYCFARRRSELSGLDLEQPGQGTGVLKLGGAHLEIRLRRSKSNLNSEDEVYVVPTAPNRAAVKAIERWIERANIEPGEPVLRRVFKSGRISSRRLDPQSIALIVKDRLVEHLRHKGLSKASAAQRAEHYSGHSLRVGFAVASAEAGAGVLAIQTALGHKSPAMAARYARAAERARTSPHLLGGVALGGVGRSPGRGPGGPGPRPVRSHLRRERAR